MNKIPKVIHYCWFGGSEPPELVQKCIESWKKYLPDYEIIEWNESNFDININNYVRQAYESKKWAFITDYVRLYALYEHGGIYMDTDVEIIKNIDVFLNHDAFSGFETNQYIPTAIMGSKPKNKWIKVLLEYYADKDFIKSNGELDTTTNVVTITNITKELYDIELDNSYQELNDGVVIYPKEYFCPKDYNSGNIHLTKNTYAIHHFNGSWWDEENIKTHKMNLKITKILGSSIGNKYIYYSGILKKNGIIFCIKKAIEKTKKFG